MNEGNVIEFLKEFIDKHPRLDPEEEIKLANLFRHAFDVKQRLLLEQERVFKKLAKPNLLTSKQQELEEELEAINEMLQNNKEIQNIDYYRNKLIEHNLRLVITVANHYSDKGLELEDLIQEGILGFIRAIEKFDPNEGTKLGTYAVWWIRQKITRALSNKTRMIRLPVHITTDVTKVLTVIRQNDYDVDEVYVPLIAKELQMTQKYVKELFQYIISFSPANQVTSADIFNNEEEKVDDNFQNFVDMYAYLHPTHLRQMSSYQLIEGLNTALEELPEMERDILSRKYGWKNYEPHSYDFLKEMLKKTRAKTVNSKRVVNKAFFSILENIL